MRTTLSVDDDVLQAAKELAARDGKTAGQVLSDLARSALTGSASAHQGAAADPLDAELDRRFGIRPRRAPGTVITNSLINRIRAEEGI
ncbi:MAG: hypothetical protein LBK95_13575 [Bifidobacteriaceae bacterium]|jgi:hypothetical protein|nr:hypothetical protein [Bifidobacteriaceae bacterium]